jgi:hypothetical protein
MALIECPECSHRVSDRALACPSCGYPMEEAAGNRRRDPAEDAPASTSEVKPVQQSSDVERLMRFEAQKKSQLGAYLLWAFTGGVGGHRFYTGRYGSAVGIIVVHLTFWLLIGLGFADDEDGWIVVAGIVALSLAVWLVVDLFSIGKWINDHNNSLISEGAERAEAPSPPEVDPDSLPGVMRRIASNPPVETEVSSAPLKVVKLQPSGRPLFEYVWRKGVRYAKVPWDGPDGLQLLYSQGHFFVANADINSDRHVPYY